MTTLTSKQAFEMAKQARDFANEILDFRDRNAEELTAKEARQLEKQAMELIKVSNKFVGVAAASQLQVAEDFLEQLRGATKTMRAEVKKLKDAARALDMLAAVIGLGGALVTGNPAGIGAALKEVVVIAFPPAVV